MAEEPQQRVCPKCKGEFLLERWQQDDGPCADGEFYCIECIKNNLCACHPDSWRGDSLFLVALFPLHLFHEKEVIDG